MISLLTVLVTGSMIQKPVDTKIIAASMFKNGYAVVIREAPLPADGHMLISDLPTAVLGTLWIDATSGRVQRVVATSVPTESVSPFSSLAALLDNNKGRKVFIDAGDLGKFTGEAQGVFGAITTLKTSAGFVAIPVASVRSITSPDPEFKTGVKVKGETRAWSIDIVGANAGSKVRVLSLERGLTWVPAYTVDITDKAKLTLTGKATILNDLGDISNASVKLITGFPWVRFLNAQDPLTSGVNVDQFTGMLQALDKFDAAPGGAMSNQMMSQGRAAERRAYQPEVVNVDTSSAEDLFFYELKNFSLKHAERMATYLVSGQAEYEHIYSWDVSSNELPTRGIGPSPMQMQDVWHSVSFKNPLKIPLTTAAAITTSGGELLGQDMLTYTSPGANVELKITKALDVAAEAEEEEVSRERGALRQNNIPTYDLVTLKGTLAITNRKSEAIKLRISKTVVGSVDQASNEAKTSKLGKGLRDVNGQSLIHWQLTLEPGKHIELNYTYKIYVPTGGN